MVRLMLVVALALSLAACGGGSDGLSRSEEKELEALVAAAEAAKAQADAARAEAEAARAEAEAARVQAEAEKAQAEAEVQHQLREAQRAREAADLARQQAEEAREAAQAAQQAADAARGDATAAEREREEAEAAAAAATQAQLQAEAGRARAGLVGTQITDAPGVTAKYQAPALVTVPGTAFDNPSGSSAGRWYVTRAGLKGTANEDTIVVYSDVGPNVATPIQQAHALTGRPEHPDKTYTEVGNFLETTIVAADANFVTVGSSVLIGHTTNIEVNRDTDDPPDGTDDETSPISGTFDGVSGTFRCAATPSATACSVRNTGAGYVLGDGTWTFRTSKTAKVSVADDRFMYFGWWRRRATASDTFTYRVFSQPTADLTGSGFNDLGGSAVYEGPAIGQYAIHPPLGTSLSHGEFNATARFTANFGTNTLSGTVSEFDVAPGWSLALQGAAGNMADGSIDAGNVSWTIEGTTQTGGMWTGYFHSEVDPYAGHQPDGLTGTFDADYGGVGKLRGAYGAHRR